MATNRPSSEALVVHQLADLLRTNGHRVLHGDSKVCFTSDSLKLLNMFFQSAKLNPTSPASNGRPRTTSSPPIAPPVTHLRINTKLRDDLVFLNDFLQKIQTVKIIHNSPTLQGNVLLDPFRNIVFLEIKKIPPHMIIGLTALRHQLETLICSQSVSKIEDLINDCGGDSAQPGPWPRLKSLFLDHNFIKNIDNSLQYLTALEVLDLSHNRLEECSKILEFAPHVKHLNLSSNRLRIIPIWSPNNDPCPLITLKMRQNLVEEIKGIQNMKLIEELDLSDNFITVMPKQIRDLPKIKRLFFARNPFTYASNYRQEVIQYLPYVYTQEERELMIDNRPLTSKEKQMIPNRINRQTSNAWSVPSSNSPPVTTTTAGSTTETDSVTAGSRDTVVTRRRTAKKRREARLRPLDQDETPAEQATSGSENEAAVRSKLRGRSSDSRPEYDHPYLAVPLPPSLSITDPNGNRSESDNNASRNSMSVATTSSLPRKTINDRSESPKTRKSYRSRKSDHPTKLILEVVDVSHETSDDTPVPDSPPSDRHLSLSFQDQHRQQIIPVPILEPSFSLADDQVIGDSIRTTFFVTDQTTLDTSNGNRLLIIELDPMYLIEKDNDQSEVIEKIKYSAIEFLPTNENEPKIVEFTFKRQRNEIERRVYLFDTIQDQKAFVDEVERYLGPSTPVRLEAAVPTFLTCTQCGKSFPLLTTMQTTDYNGPPICLSCQTKAVLEPSQLMAILQTDTNSDPTVDNNELDHRLHLHVATEHFTHDNEQIKMHFKCLVVRSTTSKHFVAQTILSNHGIYIFQYEPANSDAEWDYSLVGKDLLTNVLMLDVGYQLQTFTIELQSAAFAFLLADKDKTQEIVNNLLNLLSPIVQSGEGALQKISRISSDEYRQRLFQIIRSECNIMEPNDEMIDFYSIMIRMDQAGNGQMIALLLLRNWILMIEDAYKMIGSRHVRLPAQQNSPSSTNPQLKCDLLHLVNVTNYVNRAKLFVFDFVDESETKQFRWQLESLTTDSKEDFLRRVRDTYKSLMDIPMPEKFEMF